MRKYLMTGTILLTCLSLSACSLLSKESSKKEDSTTVKTGKVNKNGVDNSQYDAVIDELMITFSDGTGKGLTTEVENKVKETEFPDGHDNIKVILTDKDEKKKAEDSLAAINNNKATKDQNNDIYLIRQQISDIAKKLPNDTVTISYGYPKSAGQFETIAKSSKTKDIIPIGKYIAE